MEINVSGKRTFGFHEEFYLETQWKPALVLLFLKKSRKAREARQKGKDLPIETGKDVQRWREHRNEALVPAATVGRQGRLGPPESVKR